PLYDLQRRLHRRGRNDRSVADLFAGHGNLEYRPIDCTRVSGYWSVLGWNCSSDHGRCYRATKIGSPTARATERRTAARRSLREVSFATDSHDLRTQRRGTASDDSDFTWPRRQCL